MIIKYFYINEYGEIIRYETDTTDKEYVSHTEDTVTIHDGYSDSVYHRKFEPVKQELVKMKMNEILGIQAMTEEDLD
jgi:hypothetical protein